MSGKTKFTYYIIETLKQITMKTNLKILTGAVLFTAALLVVGTIATNQENLQEQNKTLLASADVNSNNVIFEGKCGESKPKSKEAKCGEGK